jgi:hypothetical protein
MAVSLVKCKQIGNDCAVLAQTLTLGPNPNPNPTNTSHVAQVGR